MSTAVRTSKLKFKGDKKKKRKHADDDEPAAGPSRKRAKEKDDDIPDETWVLPTAPNELRGPTFIVQPGEDSNATVVTFQSATNRVVLSSLHIDAEQPILDRVPTDVAQVWVTTRIAGSTTINLRTGSGEGKFLSCNTLGVVSADRDARGPQEEWTPVVLPDGMLAFMNVYEKYLSVDETAGGSWQLRGDSEEVGFRERFWVKVQQKYKREAGEEERKKMLEAAGEEKALDEMETNKMYQTWGAGKSVVSQADRKELKQAKKDGRLAEALLERRAKLKSDRFC